MPQPAYRFQLLAPLGSQSVAHRRAAIDPGLYRRSLVSLQQLRGRAYLQDGAIQSWELDALGRHCMDDDERCWHFLLVDPAGQTIGCARYLLHPPEARYEQLRVSQSPLAQDPFWGSKLRQAVEDTLERTRNEQVGYAELGGWAIAEEYRNTKAALEILLGSYLWAEMMGHCLCSCTATVRNHSSSILRKMGASSLTDKGEPLPAYFDPQYGCSMELLGFDSRSAPSRFTPLLNEMRPKLAQFPVVHPSCEGRPNLFFAPVRQQPSWPAQPFLTV